MKQTPPTSAGDTADPHTGDEHQTGERTLAGFARRPVAAIAAAAAAVLLLTNGRVGYFGDELYFLVAGRHPNWSYADQGPLIPLLARAMDTVFPGSIAGLRLPATVLCVLGIVAAALLARELGGNRTAQTITAAAYALSSMAGSHTLHTGTVDMLMWTLSTLLLVRWVRIRDDRLLLALGVVTAIALQNKWLIAAFWCVVAVAALVDGPRAMLRRPALWIAAAAATAVSLPALIWQARNGWPQLWVAEAIPNDGFMNYRLVFLPLMITNAGILFGIALGCFGLWRLLTSPHLRPYRFLGWTVLALAALFLLFGGRSGYMAGIFGICWAAGAVELQRRPPPRPTRWMFGKASIAVSAIIALTWLPILPSSWPTPAKPNTLMMTGLPGIADTVADAYSALPEDERTNTAIVTQWYWDAAVLDRYGPERGLPDSYSAHRGMWDFGPPPADTDTVVFVDADREYLQRYFHDVRPLTTITSGGMANLFSRPIPVWLCSGPREPWPLLWTDLRHF
jgi:hypothetical protein